MPFNPEKLAKLVGKGPTTVRTGGKGTVRRKHKVVRKTATHDDKRLKATLNKLSVRDIPAIEEVNLFKDDGTVIHFVNPKVTRDTLRALAHTVAAASDYAWSLSDGAIVGRFAMVTSTLPKCTLTRLGHAHADAGRTQTDDHSGRLN